MLQLQEVHFNDLVFAIRRVMRQVKGCDGLEVELVDYENSTAEMSETAAMSVVTVLSGSFVKIVSVEKPTNYNDLVDNGNILMAKEG